MFNNVYLKDLNTTVFDIETTGLLHSRDCIINAGFCSSMGDVWQNFTEDPADEKRVVTEALERMDKQARNARNWRDVVNTFFHRFSGIDDEKGRIIYD